MFIRAVQKKDKTKNRTYTYFRLTHSYRVGNKTRQTVILNLGKLEGLDTMYHKPLANRIEELIMGTNSLFSSAIPAEVEALAQGFAKQISKEKIFPSQKGKPISKDLESNLQTVDLETIEQQESKTIGGEWLVKQTFDRLEIPTLLKNSGLTDQQVAVSLSLLTAKLLHPSSELETQRWLKENSGASQLYNTPSDITRYMLYQSTTKMFTVKEYIDTSIYNAVSNLFCGQSKIVIYDLTNMYFEGQMLQSDKATFGRSKQKRNDRKLIGLAVSIDSLGFIRSSTFYDGNVSEPATFIDLLETVSKQLIKQEQTPLIVMDAGIATEENLAVLRSEKYKYDYVCVSRAIPKQYDKLTQNPQTIQDNRGNNIHLTKVLVKDKPDNFLHIKSDQKKLKEMAINQKLSQRFEDQLNDIKQKLPKKGTLKKISKVHEKVGAIKAKLSKIGYLYDITYIEEKDIVLDLNWKRIEEKEKPKGEYFLRYTQNAIDENQLWDAYNLTRDVEAVFRCLKSDLNVRPIYHQKDKYIAPHIWLSVLSYQMVNYIRRNLKEADIHDSWTSIVEKMKSMQTSLITVKNQHNENIYIKLCTKPTLEQKKIFDALKFKHRPYVRKTKVVT